jgi:hypothetical protein
MELGSLFVIFALLILVGLFVSRPFFEKQPVQESAGVDPTDHELSSLMAERDRVLNALQELDFDAALGKIPEEDYPPQREALLKQGVVILRRIDELQPQGSQTQNAEERLHAAVAARQSASGLDTSGGIQPITTMPRNGHLVNGEPDDEIEALLANRRRERQGKASGFCPQCGSAVQKTDRFCPKCGEKIG